VLADGEDRAAGLACGADGELALDRVADRERARGRVGVYARMRAVLGPRGGERLRAAGLGAEEPRPHARDGFERLELVESLRDLRQQHPRADRTDDRVRKLPAELLRSLVGDRLRALGRERVHVPADESPREQAAEVSLERAAVVEAPADEEDLRAEARGGEERMVVRGTEHERL